MDTFNVWCGRHRCPITRAHSHPPVSPQSTVGAVSTPESSPDGPPKRRFPWGDEPTDPAGAASTPAPAGSTLAAISARLHELAGVEVFDSLDAAEIDEIADQLDEIRRGALMSLLRYTLQ